MPINAGLAAGAETSSLARFAASVVVPTARFTSGGISQAPLRDFKRHIHHTRVCAMYVVSVAIA